VRLRPEGARELPGRPLLKPNPVSILEGIELNRIVGLDEMEHFLTKDGYYDGWGTGVPPVRSDQGKKIIDTIESQRKKEP